MIWTPNKTNESKDKMRTNYYLRCNEMVSQKRYNILFEIGKWCSVVDRVAKDHYGSLRLIKRVHINLRTWIFPITRTYAKALKWEKTSDFSIFVFPIQRIA